MANEYVEQFSHVCKHHQTGYCKYREQCKKYHSSNICKESVCRDLNCWKRHPRSCKYFTFHGKCKYTNCAYAHNKSEKHRQIDILETEVKELKHKIAELSNTLSDMGTKIEALEVRRERGHQLPEKLNLKQVTTNHKAQFKCAECEYKCDKELILRKHTNTKHQVVVAQPEEETSCDSNC